MDAANLPPYLRWFWRVRLYIWNWKWYRIILSLERKRIPILEQNIEANRRALLRAKAKGVPDLERVLNVNLFVGLVLRDFSVLHVDMASITDIWRSTFGARQAALMLFEAAEDLTQLLGKDFREAVVRIDPSGELLSKTTPICKRLGQFLQAHHSVLDHTRNALAAHREHDGLAFLGAMEQLNTEEIKQISAKFIEIMTDLSVALTSTITHAVEKV